MSSVCNLKYITNVPNESSLFKGENAFKVFPNKTLNIIIPFFMNAMNSSKNYQH